MDDKRQNRTHGWIKITQILSSQDCPKVTSCLRTQIILKVSYKEARFKIPVSYHGTLVPNLREKKIGEQRKNRKE